MADIYPLSHLAEHDFQRLISGYTSTARYAVHKVENPEHTQITLQMQTLPQPYQKKWPNTSNDLTRYNHFLQEGLSLGAFVSARLVGLAIVEPHWWNHTLWVWEFHVDNDYRGQGIGQQLMAALAEQARTAGFRALVCETQNTNVPAITFYRKVGFEIEGIDLSYYTNHDVEDGEVAIFMKRKL